MPQMMPMLWIIMLSFTMSILLITIIFLHFFNLPALTNYLHKQKMTNFTLWIWSW